MIDRTPEIYCAIKADYDDYQNAEMAANELSAIGISGIKIHKPLYSPVFNFDIAIVNNEAFWELDEALTKMFSKVDIHLETIKKIAKKYNGKICIDIAFYEYGTYPTLLFSGENMKKIRYLEADISIDPYSMV